MVRFSPKTRDGQVGDGIAISKNGKSQQTKQKNDGELIAEFQKKCTEDNSLRYEEREVATLRKQYLPLANSGDVIRPAVSSLVRESGFPELGPTGSSLASSDFGTTASVLAIQQYNSRSAPTAVDMAQKTAQETSEDSDSDHNRL
ncbi:hypothetical protein ACLOJK_010034 [Asimina triloba]